MNDKYQPTDSRQDNLSDEDDPLAELARIVAGEIDSYTSDETSDEASQDVVQQEVEVGAPLSPSAELEVAGATEHADELVTVEPDVFQDLEQDLEAELMDELSSAAEPTQFVPEAELDNATLDDIAVALNDKSAAIQSGDPADVEEHDQVVEAYIPEPAADSFSEPEFVQDINTSINEPQAISSPELVEAVASSEPETLASADSAQDFQSELMTALETELGKADELAPKNLPSQQNEPQDEYEAVAEEQTSVVSYEDANYDNVGSDPEMPVSSVQATSLEDDLGAAFANEFEQMAAEKPAEEIQGSEQSVSAFVSEPDYQAEVAASGPVEEPLADDQFSAEHDASATDSGPQAAAAEVVETAISDNLDDTELDFAAAFAEELDAQQLPTDPTWQQNVAVEEGVMHPDTADQHHGLSETVEDPANYGLVADLEENSPVHHQTAEMEQGGSSKKYAVAALVIALFAGFIVLGYGLLGGDTQTASTETPIIRASSDPVKVKPEDPGGRVVANQDNPSYEKVEGNELASITQENLVSTTEEPATIDTNALQEAENLAPVLPKGDERLQASEPEASAGDAARTSTVTPRVVQVVTVKPDGTIVRKPVAKPELSTDTPGSNLASQTQQVANAQTPSILTEAKPVQTQTVKPLEPIEGARTTNEPGVPTASPIPKPEPTPAPKPVQIASTQPTTTAQAPEPAAVSSAPPSEWVVQISSQRSEAAARQSFNDMRRRYNALQGRSMQVQQADVNGSTYYRVRVQTTSRTDATQLCTSIANAGGNCFVTRG